MSALDDKFLSIDFLCLSRCYIADLFHLSDKFSDIILICVKLILYYTSLDTLLFNNLQQILQFMETMVYH